MAKLPHDKSGIPPADSEKRIDLQDGAYGCTCTLDKTGGLVDVSDSFCRLVGFSRDELLSASFAPWADECPLAKLLSLSPDASPAREITGFETQCRHKSGAAIDVEVTASRIPRMDGGDADMFQLAVRDISERKRAAAILAESEVRFHSFFEDNGSAMLLIEPEKGTIVAANRAAADYYGYPQDRLTGMLIEEINTLSPEEAARERTRAVREVRSFFNFAHRLASGEVRDVEVYSAPISVYGRTLLYSIVHDVTERRAAQKALRASEQRYRTIFQMSQDAIAISRLSDQTYIEVNQAFLDIIGYDRDEVIGRTREQMDIWVDPRARQKMIQTLREGSSCQNLETQFRRKCGSVFWGLISASVVEIDGAPCVLSITRDISESKLVEAQIRSLAFYDPLTGLVNRHLLLDRLRKAISASGRTKNEHALLFIDLDNFKPLNDSLGHHMGDLLLQAVATRLSSCVRKSDTVARFGGDEFIVMLEDVNGMPGRATAHARSVAEKIIALVAEPYDLRGHEWRCSASIGITLFGKRAISTVEVIQQADKAMYLAKFAGRNAARFFEPPDGTSSLAGDDLLLRSRETEP